MDIYPSYNIVRYTKKKCYPVGITVEEFKAEVPLQALLNHTAERIIEHQTDVIEQTASDVPLRVVMKCKWGFDGTSGQSAYRQNLGSAPTRDAELLSTTLVPLQITSEKAIIWQNPTPSQCAFTGL